MFVFHNVNGWEVALAEGQSAEDLYRSDLQQQHVGASVGAEEGGEAPEPTHLVIDTVAWDEVSFELEIFDRENHNLDNFVGESMGGFPTEGLGFTGYWQGTASSVAWHVCYG